MQDFEKGYFYGGGQSNYFNYEKLIDRDLIWKWKVEAVLRYVKNGKILDVGGTSGLFLKRLPETFDKHCLDISKIMVRKCPFKAVAHNMELPLRNGWKNFDVITSFDTLEHIPNLRSAVENIRALLKKGGYFIITVPHNGNPLSMFDRDITHLHMARIPVWEHFLFKYFRIIEKKTKFLQGCLFVMKKQ